jgi:VWFA-related protein
MRLAALCLLTACAAWPQFRSTVPLVVAPTTVKDAKGRFVEGLDAANLVLYDNNVTRPIQADIAAYPISLVVAVESSQNSAAILDKLGSSGILFSQLLAADQGETALVSFSDKVTLHTDFTYDPDDLTHELRRMRVEGGGAAALDALSKALDMLAHRKPGRRLMVLMIAESRDRSSEAKLPEIVQQVQHLNAAVYWLTYSSILAQYTDRKVTTIGDVEAPSQKGIDKKRDATPLPANTPPMNLLGPFFELAHLTKPNLAELFTRVTGTESRDFLTKSALEQAIHAMGEEMHRGYILTFAPAPGPAGLFHTIRVEVKGRPDLKATTRAGYWGVQ